jgi:hypothetical protein
MNHPLLRAGMWFLTVVELAVGLVATLAPRAFYDYVPRGSTSPRRSLST